MPARSACLLTPKNLYRLLTGHLAGFSTQIIPKAHLKGGTIVRFYRAFLSAVLPDGMLDRFFPLDGSHPREQSSLLNRTGPMPAALRRALDESLSADQLLRLMKRLMGQMLGWNYRQSLLENALTAFEEACFRDDLFIPDTHQGFLRVLREWSASDSPRPARMAISPWLFRHAARLTFLCLFALYGAQMNCDSLSGMINAPSSLPGALWDQLCQSGPRDGAEILTPKADLFSAAPLPAHPYIPHAISPEHILEQLSSHHRVLLSGMGGAGKTELARQALHLAVQLDRYARVAAVSYAEGLIGSIQRTFPSLQSLTDEPLFMALQELLRETDSRQSTLLVIDHLDQTPEQDPALTRLSALPCDILVTSRLQALPSFQTVELPPLDHDGAVKLFQSRYQVDQPLDPDTLDAVLNRAGGNPFVISVLCHLCNDYCLSVTALEQRLAGAGWTAFETSGVNGPIRALRELYDMSDLTAEEKVLLRLIAMLRCQPWKPDELLAFTPDVTGDLNRLVALLQRLVHCGWLTKGEHGYAMDALISEIIALSPYQSEEFPQLWTLWAGRLTPPVDPEKQRLYDLVLKPLTLFRERLSEEGFSVLKQYELSMMTRAACSQQQLLPEIHRAWLASHDHSSVEDVDYQIICLLSGILWHQPEACQQAAEALLKMDAAVLLATEQYDTLCNVLEIGGQFLSRDTLDALFDHIRPPEAHTAQLIIYLNFLGGKQRYIDKQPEAALQTLAQARTLIEAQQLSGSVEEAANDTRTAYSLADLGRWQETLPLMRRVLNNLKGRGYAEDSPTMQSTQSAYHFFIGNCSDRQLAIDRLEESVRRMRATDAWNEELFYGIQNGALLLMEEGNPDQAETLIRELLEKTQRRDAPPASSSVYLIDLWHAAVRIFYAANRFNDALACATRAWSSSMLMYGMNHINTLKLRGWIAIILSALGQTSEAAALMRETEACAGPGALGQLKAMWANRKSSNPEA